MSLWIKVDFHLVGTERFFVKFSSVNSLITYPKILYFVYDFSSQKFTLLIFYYRRTYNHHKYILCQIFRSNFFNRLCLTTVKSCWRINSQFIFSSLARIASRVLFSQVHFSFNISTSCVKIRIESIGIAEKVINTSVSVSLNTTN